MAVGQVEDIPAIEEAVASEDLLIGQGGHDDGLSEARVSGRT
jgi:hypothetical protein